MSYYNIIKVQHMFILHRTIFTPNICQLKKSLRKCIVYRLLAKIDFPGSNHHPIPTITIAKQPQEHGSTNYVNVIAVWPPCSSNIGPEHGTLLRFVYQATVLQFSE